MNTHDEYMLTLLNSNPDFDTATVLKGTVRPDETGVESDINR